MIIENQAIVINALNNNNINFFYGKSFYYSFIEFFYPFTDFNNLSEWFTEKFYPHLFYNTNSRFAFSYMAEGYLNFGVFLLMNL